MDKRFKVLISAYACEPGKGSEPEVGWQWAWQMSHYHEVTVLTRSNNRPAIEAEISGMTGPKPHFVYLDLDPLLLKCKKRFQTHRGYYILWQLQARKRVRAMLREGGFDLLHHITFAAFRFPTAVWGHGIPCVWGPVGGVESIPAALLPWRNPAPLLLEVMRNFDNFLRTSRFGGLRRRAKQSTLVLASTRKMHEVFRDLGVPTTLMPAIGLRTAEFPAPPRTVPRGPLRLLFVGNLVPLKGLDLGLEALKACGTEAQLTLIGDGAFKKSLQALAAKLGLESRIQFRGRLPRAQVLEAYKDFDVCLFPSLHDTGGYAVIEAMCAAMPAICLAVGGPDTAVQPGCGIPVPLGSRATVIAGLADAIRSYDQNRERVVQDGRTARQSIEENYDWDHKAKQMNDFYQEILR